jgi:hypothetical protein
MKRLSLTFTVAVFSTLLFAQSGVPQDRPQQSTSVTDEQVRAILAAKDPSDAAARYSSLFKSVTADGLRRLQLNPSDTIAIQAAWEEVELTVPVQPDRVVSPDRDKLSRFIGFLEGRARVQTPQWWAEALLDAQANCRGNVYAGGLNMAELREKRPNAGAPPHQASFDKLEGKPVVRVGSESAPIPEGLREKLGANGFADRVCALITASNCYVAVYDSVGYPYRLACVERSSAKIRWIAEVWASWWGHATGRHHHWVEVTEQGNRVAVFGVASVGFHAEVFRVDDGVNVLRFSNSYSGR